MKKKLLVLGIFLASLNSFAAEYGTFDSFYSRAFGGFWTWTAIIVGSIAVAAITYFTCGTGSATIPSWMATVAGWIGSTAGLSGIAATNYGLALLGGGSIAAGGLGIAGGVAVLTGALSFGTDVAISYGTDIAIETWSKKKFIEANRHMLTLPIPRNDSGGDAYEDTVEMLAEKFDSEKGPDDPSNQQVLLEAIDLLLGKLEEEEETDKDYCTKNSLLLALLYFQTNDFQSASKYALQAWNQAQESDNKSTMPQFIWATSQCALEEAEAPDFKIHFALAESFLGEPENKLIPQMTGCVLDRVMYKFHYGKVSINELECLLSIISSRKLDEDLSNSALEIFTTRCLIELKRTKQDIHICTSDSLLMKGKNFRVELLTRLGRNEALINLMNRELVPTLSLRADDWPEESSVTYEKLKGLLHEYEEDLPITRNQINSHEPGWLELLPEEVPSPKYWY